MIISYNVCNGLFTLMKMVHELYKWPTFATPEKDSKMQGKVQHIHDHTYIPYSKYKNG